MPDSRLSLSPAAFLSQARHTMESRFAQIAALPQKDRAPAFITALNEILARPDQAGIAQDIHLLVDCVVQDNVGLVAARLVLSELVRFLQEGVVKDLDVRKQIVQDTLEILQPRLVSYEELVSLVLQCSQCFASSRNA